MKHIALAVSLLALTVTLNGCGSPPVKKPAAESAFATPPDNDGPPDVDAKAASVRFFNSSLKDAKDSDSSSGFDIKADGLAAFAIALAGGGALTNAHSDLYKSAGMLLGLGLGAKQYFKPEDQRSIYFNSAESYYCSGIHMQTLSNQLKGVAITEIDEEIKSSNELASTLKGLLYSRSFAVATLDPFTSHTLISAALNADADLEAKVDALEFLKSISVNAHRRDLEILRYKISEINKVAYDLDGTLKTIAKMSVSPDSVLKAYTATDPTKAKAGAVLLMDQADFDNAKSTFQMSPLGGKLPGIIETINAFTACSVHLKPLKAGT